MGGVSDGISHTVAGEEPPYKWEDAGTRGNKSSFKNKDDQHLL